MQLLLQFVQFFMKPMYMHMSWPEDMDVLWIQFFSFVSFFLFCKLKLFHDSSYIPRQTSSGGIHKLSEFAWVFFSLHATGALRVLSFVLFVIN